MPDFGLSTTFVAIVLSLVAAALWGTSDFTGGLLGRRAPILGVLLATQAVGFVIAALVTGLRGEPGMVGPDLWLALGGAVLGALGVSSLYQGLAVGRMGIVAPVAAVLTAVTPALIGVVLQGVPPLVVIVGLAVAIVAVVTVSASPDDGSGRPAGLQYGLVAGVSLGLLSVVFSRISMAYVFAPLAVLRGGVVLIFAVFIVARRLPWRVPRSEWWLVLVVGVVDLAGNAAFITAVRTGDLAITAVLSSMYPVVTVLLAASVLREKITLTHAAGVALAMLAVVLITGGSA
jgi:drug/metabolite transporter (DMT)-like permease